MSGYTMTQPELYYSFSAPGTALNTFTTEASLMGGYPIPQIPATFFNKLGQLSSSMKIRAYGNVSDTTVAPTFTLAPRLQTSPTSYSTSALGWTTTPTAMAAASLTNAWWQLDMDVILRSIAAGAATSTISAFGTLTGPGFASPGGSLPATNTTSVVSTLDVTGATSYYFTLGAACGTSNAANAIQLQGLKIYLEN
jgi:hypothetical protein